VNPAEPTHPTSDTCRHCGANSLVTNRCAACGNRQDLPSAIRAAEPASPLVASSPRAKSGFRLTPWRELDREGKVMASIFALFVALFALLMVIGALQGGSGQKAASSGPATTANAPFDIRTETCGGFWARSSEQQRKAQSLLLENMADQEGLPISDGVRSRFISNLRTGCSSDSLLLAVAAASAYTNATGG
jgi:hypothetical protein